MQFSRLQGATSPGTPNTPVSSVTPQGSTTPPCRDTDSPRQYLLVSRPTKPCSWPECLLENTRSVIPCTADRPPRMPASPTFMTVAWTIWPIQRFMSFSTAIRFTQSIWLSFTDAWNEGIRTFVLAGSQTWKYFGYWIRWQDEMEKAWGTSAFSFSPMQCVTGAWLIQSAFGEIGNHKDNKGFVCSLITIQYSKTGPYGWNVSVT